ncbi:MAG: hypothetical protein JRI26_12480 [Deltaproteobacteria bacterium]|nr:hypothetical protein [Deltaproteobacteria bacterium]
MWVFALRETLWNCLTHPVYAFNYGYLAFDSEGRVNQKFLDAENLTAVSMIPPIPFPGESPNIVHAGNKFAEKRFKNEFTWLPTPELE